MAGKTNAFEGCIECPFDDAIIVDITDYVFGDFLSPGEIYDLHLPTVHAVTEQEDLEVLCLAISVDSALEQVHR
jgi:hypothetical protein